MVELEMELEVGYNENYCVEGQVERRRGATDRDDGGDMGSFFSRPVLIFPTILNRATNGFETAVSRVLLGGREQT